MRDAKSVLLLRESAASPAEVQYCIQSLSRLHGIQCHGQEFALLADPFELLEDFPRQRKIYDGGLIRIQHIRLL